MAGIAERNGGFVVQALFFDDLDEFSGVFQDRFVATEKAVEVQLACAGQGAVAGGGVNALFAFEEFGWASITTTMRCNILCSL